MTSSFHIGNLIREQLKAQNITIVSFAKSLSCSRTNVYKLLDKPTLDTQTLMRISGILHYNFFELLSFTYEDRMQMDNK